MSAQTRTLWLYRRALRLYPRSFREEYGPDLVLLVAAQLGDEPARRVQARSAVDLALTVPTRHLEARMNRPPSSLVPAIFGAVALSAMVVGLVVGHLAVLVVCLAVAGASGWLALLSASRAAPVFQVGRGSGRWWKLLAAGGGLMATLIAVTTATGELPQGGWYVAMATGLVALLLLGTGAVLGVAHLAGRRSHHVAG